MAEGAYYLAYSSFAIHHVTHFQQQRLVFLKFFSDREFQAVYTVEGGAEQSEIKQIEAPLSHAY